MSLLITFGFIHLQNECIFRYYLWRKQIKKICSPPFNLHPEKWLEGHPVNFFFQGCILRKVGCHTYQSKKNRWTPWKKIGVDATLKKSQLALYENLGRLYRVPFKPLLRCRVHIKRVIISLFISLCFRDLCSKLWFLKPYEMKNNFSGIQNLSKTHSHYFFPGLLQTRYTLIYRMPAIITCSWLQTALEY